MQPKNVALLAKQAADDKQAENIVVLDVAKLTSLAHYFLITHGNSDRHVRAIAQNIEAVLETHKVKRWHLEGMDSGQWVLLDFGAVIAHVFTKDVRGFYGLERLWGEAKQL